VEAAVAGHGEEALGKAVFCAAATSGFLEKEEVQWRGGKWLNRTLLEVLITVKRSGCSTLVWLADMAWLSVSCSSDWEADD
jgi:hypothetical protein